MMLSRLSEINSATHPKQKDLRIKYIKQALDIDPNHEQAVAEMVGVHFENKEFSKAVELLNKSINIVSAEDDHYKLGTLYDFLGESYVQLKKYDQARQAFKTSIKYGLETNPNGCPFQALGLLYAQMGNLERSTELFDEAAVIDQKPRSYFQAAMHYFNLYDVQRTLEFTEKALELEDDPRYELIRVFAYIMNRDYQKAKDILKEISRKKRTENDSLIALGHLKIVEQDYKKAIRLLADRYRSDYELSLLQDMKNISSWNLYPWIIDKMAFLGLGWIHANQNSHEKAIRYFEKIVEKYPDDLLALLGLANSHLHMKNLDKAESIYTRILKKHPDNRFALAELATIHFSRGNDKNAEKEFKRALAQDKINFTCPYEGLGLLYLKQGKMEKAAKHFEKAIEINPNVEYKKYNGLAKIKIEQGHYLEAKKLLNKSIENYPYDPEARNLLEKLKKLY